jgi:hypothetical protein
MSFDTGNQVGISSKGIVKAGPATIISLNMDMGPYHPPMYDIQYPNGQETAVIHYDLFPFWDVLRVGDTVPDNIPLRKAIHKQRLDQMVREVFERKGQDAEPGGGPADIIRACLNASVPKGAGRLSLDNGRRWTKITTNSNS